MRNLRGRAAGWMLALAAVACNHGHAGSDVIDAPIDAIATVPADAPVDAPPPYCTPAAGSNVAAPVWATIDGEAVLVTGPTGDPRVFVVDRLGKIWIFDRDGSNPRVFLDATALVDSAFDERGLLGLAFPPDFATTHRFYIDYTRRDPNKMLDGYVVIAEYQVSATDPDVADPATRREVLLVDHYRFPNHNGGTIAFGPDGYLYIAIGDGGGSGGVDYSKYAQDPTMLIGKILRIDPRASGAAPYTVPSDNPYVAVAGDRPEIWHVGLRNPYRMAFDDATGALYIADVGGSHFEEVDIQPRGQRGMNFGWFFAEGNDLTLCTAAAGCDASAFTAPTVVHSHRDGWCAIIGGEVYRGTCFPDLVGRYFYTDYCRTDLWWFAAPTGAGTVTPAIAATGLTASMTSVHADGLGELYITAQSGEIRRLGATP